MRNASREALAFVFEQLAAASRGGFSLSEALKIILQDDQLRRRGAAFESVRAALAAGQPLSRALEQSALSLPPATVELVRWGEQGERLPAVLQLLADDYRRLADTRAGVREALAWPIGLFAALFVVVAVIMIFVIPAFKQVYTSFGADLPSLTLLLMTISDFIVDYWWIVLLVVVVGGILVARYRSRVVALGSVIDGVVVRTPFVRGYIRTEFAARLARILSRVVNDDLSAAHAMAHMRANCGDWLSASWAGDIERKLAAGASLREAIQQAPAVPRRLVFSLELGEHTGEVAQALEDAARTSESAAGRGLIALQRAITVTTYVCLGVAIGFVIVAMYLPIFMLGSAV